MELTQTKIITFRALLSQMRQATRLLAELVDEMEDNPACSVCGGKGVLTSVLGGVTYSAPCTCARGDFFRADAPKKSGRDRAAGDA